MKCEEVRERLLDLAGAEPAGAAKEHVDGCAECAAKLRELRATMALLDEWKAPEVSPYFEARLRARLREEQSASPQGWLAWLRSPALLRPVAAGVFALVVGAGVWLYQYSGQGTGAGARGGAVAVQAKEGSAVADLQALDKNEDLLANFDLLDDVASEDAGTVQR